MTRADKETLDLLAAWPRSTRPQLAGLLGGVSRHRAGQALRSLLRRALVRADGPRYVLTDDALKYLAHRDRAAVGPTLAQWSAEISTRPPQPTTGTAPVYAGTALRALAAQPEHQAGLTDFAAALVAEVGRAPDYELFDLLPTARSAVGYWHLGTPYVVHPDASFVLVYRGEWRP